MPHGITNVKFLMTSNSDCIAYLLFNNSIDLVSAILIEPLFRILQIVGAFWYLLALERNDACWQEACIDAGNCSTDFLYCGNQNMDGYAVWNRAKESVLQSKCRADLDDNNPPFDFGIYTQALSSGIVSSQNFIVKYCYCLWWGLQNLR